MIGLCTVARMRPETPPPPRPVKPVKGMGTAVACLPDMGAAALVHEDGSTSSAGRLIWRAAEGDAVTARRGSRAMRARR